MDHLRKAGVAAAEKNATKNPMDITNPSMRNNNMLQSMTVKDFAKNHGFVSIHPKIRVNTNGYPYLTFISDTNNAENIYFSKKASEYVEEGEPLVKGFLSEYFIGFTENEQGESRLKLYRAESERIDIEDLF